ncbi:MAG: hypothetical protein C0P77_005620 [Thermoanaerobacterales bacterium]
MNVSLWRGSWCAETFHLSPAGAAELVSFLVPSFAASVPQPQGEAPRLRAVPPSRGRPARPRPPLADRLRARVADALERTAAAVRPRPEAAPGRIAPGPRTR